MVRPRRPRASGFTVIELMISLVVIGIMAATIAPSLTELLADNRQASAAMEVLRMARHARAQARATGLAHALRFRGNNDEPGSFGLGTLRVYAGMNTKCRQTPWALTFTPAGNGLGPSVVFDMGEFNPRNGTAAPRAADRGVHVIQMTTHVNLETNAQQGDYSICYQPNGEIYAGTPLPTTPQTQPVLFRIRRTIDNGDGPTARGRERQVVQPVGGNARLR